MRISDWSSDVCSSDLGEAAPSRQPFLARTARARHRTHAGHHPRPPGRGDRGGAGGSGSMTGPDPTIAPVGNPNAGKSSLLNALRSDEHTSELQSLMRITYAVFCLKNKIVLDIFNSIDHPD